MAAFAFGLAFAAGVVADDTAEAQRRAQRRCPTGQNPHQTQRGWVCCPPGHGATIHGTCFKHTPSPSVTVYRGHGSCSDWNRNRRNNQTGTPTDPCDYDEKKVRDRGTGYEGGTGYGYAGPSFSSFWEWALWRSRD